MVGMLMVKLVAAEMAETQTAGTAVGPVLQVTPKVPATAVGVKWIWLAAVTAVVLTWQVVPEALVAQENFPAGAPPQDTTEGLAAVPFAAHAEFVK